MKKRVLAAMLTLCMLLGLLPTTAWAFGALSITQQPTAGNNYTVMATYAGQEMDQGFQWYKKAAAVTTYTLVQENPQAGELAVDTVTYGSYTGGHWASGDDQSPLSVSFLSSPDDEVTVTVSGGDAPDGNNGDIQFTEVSSGVYTAASTGGMLDIYIDNSERTSPVTATITVKRCWTPVAGQTSASLTASESGTYYCAVSKDGEGAITNTVQVVVPHTHPVCGAACSGHTESHDDVEWQAWNGTSDILSSGSYYLTADITVSKDIFIAQNATVNLCLNGYKLTFRCDSHSYELNVGASGQPSNNSTLNLCDCQDGGLVELTGGDYTCVNVWTNSTFNLYSGGVKSKGTGIGNEANSVIAVYGGSVTSSNPQYRSAISNYGTATISGGKIEGANLGINNFSNNAKLTLSGSPNISGGTADIQLSTSSAATPDNAMVDTTGYTGNTLKVIEKSLNSNTVGKYAVKGGEGKFTLTNTCYKYEYESGGMVIREDHNWATGWTNDATGHWHSCRSGCPITDNTQKDGYAAHTAVTDPAVPATCTTPGKTAGSHCSVCGYVITAQTVIPATGNHTYSGYEKNDTQHWQKCSVCQAETAKTAHIYENDQDTTCDTCGYTRTVTPPDPGHTHQYGAWASDATSHWHQCTDADCPDLEGSKKDSAAHTAVTDPAVPATCGAAGKTEGSHCSVCGYVITAQTAIPATGNHTYSGYEKNDTQHWQKCSVCQTETAKAAHIYDNDQDTTCDTCGYTRTVHTHQYGAWTSDATSHWHQCTAADCPDLEGSKKDSAAHTEDAGTVTKPATNTEKGVRTYQCSVCQRILRTEEIPMLTEPTEPTHSISGSVTDKDDKPVSDAAVKLMQGNTEVAKTTTTSGGAYSFSGVKAGTYNVVAEQGSEDDKITKTILVVLTDSDATEKNITMPDGKKNSLIEIKGSDTPAAVAGGVDEVAEDQQVEPGQTVTVTLTVEKKAESAISSDATAIKQVAGDKTVDFLDLSLVKTVTGGSNAGTTNITDTGDKVLEIVVPYDFSGKQNVAVYRYHGGSAQALTRADTGAGGTFKLGADSVIIYATKFSTYAIGYTASSSETPDPTPPTSIPPSGGGSDSPATYSPAIEKSAHGKAEVKPRAPEQGDRVTVTLTPDKGYQIDSITVTDWKGRPVTVTDNGDGTYTFIQPNGKVTISASFKTDGGYGSCPKNHTCPVARFPDTSPTAWYHDGVHYCLEHSLMGGYDTGLFGPGDHLSRVHLVQMLYNQAGRPDVTEASSFEDVAPGAWYAKAVAWAQQSGIVSGYDSRRFHPDSWITREQLAAILWRYAGSPAATGLALDFTDAGNVSGYAADALRWAVDCKIIYGKGSGILDPTGLATRAEAASMLMRYGTIKTP